MNVDRLRIHPRDVRRRAYEIYQALGTAPGLALNDRLPPERTAIEQLLQPQSQTDVSRLLPDDWDLVGAARVNLLLMGREEATRALMDVLRPYFQEPVVTARSCEPLTLVPPGQVGTMILHDICTLGLADQRRLLVWLEGAVGCTQVISTTSTPIVPLIDAGSFHATLYYRLNTLYFGVTGVPSGAV
jgi:hypothetical protein